MLATKPSARHIWFDGADFSIPRAGLFSYLRRVENDYQSKENLPVIREQWRVKVEEGVRLMRARLAADPEYTFLSLPEDEFAARYCQFEWSRYRSSANAAALLDSVLRDQALTPPKNGLFAYVAGLGQGRNERDHFTGRREARRAELDEALRRERERLRNPPPPPPPLLPGPFNKVFAGPGVPPVRVPPVGKDTN